MTGAVEEKLKEMGIVLPEAAKPVANYVPFMLSGDQLYISGQLPVGAEGVLFPGVVGATISVDQAREAACLCAINILAQAKAALGELDRVKQLVKITGFVRSGADFTEQPQVINGASDFMVMALGDAGRHSRSAVGVSSLPMDAPVEIEALFQVVL